MSKNAFTPTEAPRPLSRKKKIIFRLFAGLGCAFILLCSICFTWVWMGKEDPSRSNVCCTPREFYAHSNTGFVNLSWSPALNALCYQISKSTRAEGPYWIAGSPYGDMAPPHVWPVFFERLFFRMGTSISLFGRVPYAHFTDTIDAPGSLRYYRVRAFMGDGWTRWTSPISTRVVKGAPSPITITVDAAHSVGTLEHTWDVIGSEHVGYILNDNGIPGEHGGGTLNSALLTAHQQLGFQFVIAHGVFMSDLAIADQSRSTRGSYYWDRLDSAYDKILADGLKPIVQLSFMPPELALHPKAATVWSYHAISSPPKSYREWGDLVRALTLHLESRYGASVVRQWAFDVWNEPDVCVPGLVCYWKGSPEEYYNLYDSSVEAVRSVDPLLRVGGPVVLSPIFANSFLNHIANHRYSFGTHSAPLDFLDLRVYDAPVENWRPLLNKYHLANAEIWYTEWGLHNQGRTHITDSPYAAAWIASNLLDSLDYANHIGFWEASDDAIEKAVPKKMLYGGFGLVGLYGIPKPSYWAYYLLNQLGHIKLATSIAPSDGIELIRTCATVDSAGNLQLLLSNVTNNQWQKGNDSSLARTATFVISGLHPQAGYVLTIYRIDTLHSSVFDAWEKMGSPAWPTKEQLASLRKAGSLEFLSPPANVAADDRGSLSVELSSPMPSLSLVSITLAGSERPGTRLDAIHLTAYHSAIGR